MHLLSDTTTMGMVRTQHVFPMPVTAHTAQDSWLQSPHDEFKQKRFWEVLCRIFTSLSFLSHSSFHNWTKSPWAKRVSEMVQDPRLFQTMRLGRYTRESCLLLPGLAHNIPMASGAADQELQTGLWPETCTTSNPLGKKKDGNVLSDIHSSEIKYHLLSHWV